MFISAILPSFSVSHTAGIVNTGGERTFSLSVPVERVAFK